MTDSFRKPSESELKHKLTPIQFDVTQHEGTERPFQNEYWANHEDGIYVELVSGAARRRSYTQPPSPPGT